MTDAEYLHKLEACYPDTYRRVMWHRQQQGINTINRLRKEGYQGHALLTQAIKAGVPSSAIQLAGLPHKAVLGAA